MDLSSECICTKIRFALHSIQNFANTVEEILANMHNVSCHKMPLKSYELAWIHKNVFFPQIQKIDIFVKARL